MTFFNKKATNLHNERGRDGRWVSSLHQKTIESTDLFNFNGLNRKSIDDITQSVGIDSDTGEISTKLSRPPMFQFKTNDTPYSELSQGIKFDDKEFQNICQRAGLTIQEASQASYIRHWYSEYKLKISQSETDIVSELVQNGIPATVAILAIVVAGIPA